jgi:hypothetical protein
MTQSALAAAVQRKDWDFVALCLLIGLARTAEKFPPQTLDRLLDLLATDFSHGAVRVEVSDDRH